MFDVKRITELHQETIVRWHEGPVDNPFDGWWRTICEQHSFNFLLWHEEDIARNPDASDTQIAEVKRSIDKLNQQRNDWIEKIDDSLSNQISGLGITAADNAPQNTETPGSVIDRLSILALRIYHLEEQTQRTDASPEHLRVVGQKLAVGLMQHEDLAKGLSQLLKDLFVGRKRHQTYHQMKMYNDPSMNPYLYQAERTQTS